MIVNGDKSGLETQAKRLHQASGEYIFGSPIDDQTRCKHYHSATDIIAIRFKCCAQYYPCIYCHEESANHAPEVWRAEDEQQKAVLCGHCGLALTIQEYLSAKNQCPGCQSFFNPHCRQHNHYYFERSLFSDPG